MTAVVGNTPLKTTRYNKEWRFIRALNVSSVEAVGSDGEVTSALRLGGSSSCYSLFETRFVHISFEMHFTRRYLPAMWGTMMRRSSSQAAESAADHLSGLHGDLFQAIMHPLPLARSDEVAGTAILNQAVKCGQALYFEPAKTLESTMRALYVIRQVLRDDGHVYIVNSNPSLKPLMQEAAHCSINSNLWFLSEPWEPRALTGSATANRLFKPEHQPNAKFLSSRGIKMTNPLRDASSSSALSSSPPSLQTLDQWKLYSRGLLREGGRGQSLVAGISGKRAMGLLKKIVALESQSASIPLPKMLQGDVASKLRLVVSLDPSHDDQALQEAHERGIMTASLYSAQSSHKDEVMSQVTYPIYAGENTPAYQHFFLTWLLKVSNVSIVK